MICIYGGFNFLGYKTDSTFIVYNFLKFVNKAIEISFQKKDSRFWKILSFFRNN